MHFPNVLLLLLVLFVCAQWDLLLARRRGRPDADQRRLVYHTILLCGLIGGCFGAVMDQVTVSISPDYFSTFKDIPARTPLELRLRAADLGFAAGLVPGLIAGVCFAAAAAIGVDWTVLHKRPPISYLLIPAAVILLLAPFFAGYQMIRDPGDYLSSMQPALDASAIRRMIAVWGIHQAAYVGGLVGTVLATVKIRRDVGRKTSSGRC